MSSLGKILRYGYVPINRSAMKGVKNLEGIQKVADSRGPVCCPYCGKLFGPTALQEHLRKRHRVRVAEPLGKRKNGVAVERSAKKKKRKEKRREEPPSEDPAGWTKCSVCGCRLLLKNLQRHISHGHAGKNRRKVVGAQVKLRSDGESISRVTGKDLSGVCRFCGSRVQMKNLPRHIRQVHRDDAQPRPGRPRGGA